MRHAIVLTVAIAVLYAIALAITAWGEPDAVVADALAGRWLVVVCSCGAVGLFSRHIAALRRASDHRFVRGFDDSSIGMAILCADWRWLEVNDALCRMLGRPREELIGRSPAEITHPDDLAKSRAIVDRALARPTRAQTSSSATCGRRRRSCGRAVDSIFVRARRPEGYFFAQVRDITAEQRGARSSRPPGAPAGGGRRGSGASRSPSRTSTR